MFWVRYSLNTIKVKGLLFAHMENRLDWFFKQYWWAAVVCNLLGEQFKTDTRQWHWIDYGQTISSEALHPLITLQLSLWLLIGSMLIQLSYQKWHMSHYFSTSKASTVYVIVINDAVECCCMQAKSCVYDVRVATSTTA